MTTTEFILDATCRQGAFTLALDLRVQARALALFGPSGSGKTTTLELLAGLRTPDAGRLAVGGRVLVDRAAGIHVPARARRVGYVPQDALLFPHLSVRGNVFYGRTDAASAGLDETNRRALAEVMALLEIEPLMDRSVSGLSGGERQRVALARALQASPAFLLLDEPLAAVDLPRRRRIVEALRRIRDELAIPLVYVTHAPEEVSALADAAILLDGGRVVARGAPRDVLPVMAPLPEA